MRIDTILSRSKFDSFENLEAIASEALEKWSKSGNDPTVLRSAELTWKTPGGGSETGFVGAVADRSTGPSSGNATPLLHLDNQNFVSD